MTTLQMASLSIHANTATNKHLRALWEWARRVEADAETQFRLHEKKRAAATTRPHVHKTIAGPAKPTAKSEAKQSGARKSGSIKTGAKSAAPVAHPPVRKAAATTRKSKSVAKIPAAKPRAKSRP
jgi:hypothetical protein